MESDPSIDLGEVKFLDHQECVVVGHDWEVAYPPEGRVHLCRKCGYTVL